MGNNSRMIGESVHPSFDAWLKTEAPRVIYHYTSPQGFLGILNDQEVWASDTAHLSDSAELRYADSLVARVSKELRTEFAEDPAACAALDLIERDLRSSRSVTTLVASFSEENDLLNQWRAYCPPSGGYALGFDSAALWRALSAPFTFMLKPCIYDRTTQVRMVREVLKDCVFGLRSNCTLVDGQVDIMDNQRVLEWFDLYYQRVVRVILKHPSFVEEKEWRLFSLDPSSIIPDLRFRAGQSSLVPYFAMPLHEPIESSPLREVVVGPCRNIKTAVASTRLLLANRGYTNTTVRRSQCTLRPG